MLPGRLSKSTPIRDVVKEGQEIIVQVTKEPISTKGARCSSHISLPGRYVVYLPTLEHVGVSKRIGSDKERARLRETIESMKPPTGGLIVRTVAEGLTKKQLKQDVGYLVRLWGEVAKNREVAKAPKNLLSELDIVLKTARDLFTDDVDQIVVDDKAQYDRLCRFVEMFMPDRLKDIVYFNEDEPIFDEYGIEDEIARALSRKVPLPSGGYLILDEAEALTAIDVNTGRFVGKGSKDMEETILKTNLEAVQEIAYQLRFRNIGGLIILDLIDMERASNREKVRKTLEELLQRDKAKTTLNRISELGLIEMTRKRTRESLGRLLHEPCFYCDGTGTPAVQGDDRVRHPPGDPSKAPGPARLYRARQLPSCRRRPAHGKREGGPARGREPLHAAHPGELANRVPSGAVRSRREVTRWTSRPGEGSMTDEDDKREDDLPQPEGSGRHDARVTINKEFESFDAFIQEYVTNISRTGVFIKSQQPLPIGSPVNLRFTVIMDDIQTIEGVGEVVRLEKDPPGMGVVFRELSAYSKDLIEKLLVQRRR